MLWCRIHVIQSNWLTWSSALSCFALSIPNNETLACLTWHPQSLLYPSELTLWRPIPKMLSFQMSHCIWFFNQQLGHSTYERLLLTLQQALLYHQLLLLAESLRLACCSCPAFSGSVVFHCRDPCHYPCLFRSVFSLCPLSNIAVTLEIACDITLTRINKWVCPQEKRMPPVI